MSEVVNVVVALAVIVFVVRWATSSSESPEEKIIRTALGFRPKNVTPDMVCSTRIMINELLLMVLVCPLLYAYTA